MLNKYIVRYIYATFLLNLSAFLFVEVLKQSMQSDFDLGFYTIDLFSIFISGVWITMWFGVAGYWNVVFVKDWYLNKIGVRAKKIDFNLK